MTTILDYGLGNVRAFVAAYKSVGIHVAVASTPADLDGATHLILPGVGAFDDAMARFEASGLRPAVTRLVLEEKRPLLGVCVGMQMLGRRSEEGARAGLGWIDGEVKRFDASVGGQPRRVPHMGWNDLRVRRPISLLAGLDDARFYFLHSYYFACDRPADVLATTDYHQDFVSVAASSHVYGVQFHPEKSHQWGCRLLKNFSDI